FPAVVTGALSTVASPVDTEPPDPRTESVGCATDDHERHEGVEAPPPDAPRGQDQQRNRHVQQIPRTEGDVAGAHVQADGDEDQQATEGQGPDEGLTALTPDRIRGT